MSVHPAPVPVRSESPASVAKAPWILLAVSPLAFAVLMEAAEALTMLGVAPDLPGTVGSAIYLLLVAVLPVAVITTGIRAVRRHARGLPWIPTALGIVMAVGWVAMAISLV